MNKKILITGGSGLVGGELINQLIRSGSEVTAIYNTSSLGKFERGDVTAYQCDILDPVRLEEVMEGVSEVYHCAAFVSFSPKHKKKLYSINIEGTANVVNAALNAGVRKFIHVSSVAALGRIREGETINEQMMWTEESSNSVYGKSKFLGEMEVWRGIGEGLNAIIVNPSLILGAGDWNKGSSEIFQSAYNEFPWYTEGTSGFVDVRDVAGAMIGLMDSDISNERFILNGNNIPFRDLFTEIASCFGKRPPHKKVSSFIAGFIWRWEAVKSKLTGKDPLLTRETVNTARASIFFDNSKIKQYLQAFEFRNITDTIQFTCNRLKQINNLS